ncbi:MAG: hypothetical protein IPK22_13420 [Verrucomicrobiaceae bacterium]|nr:hypothetical protein [Verrucomicrobiaceae bacterium]
MLRTHLNLFYQGRFWFNNLGWKGQMKECLTVMSYYHSKIEDISAMDVRSIFDDLCFAIGWPLGQYYEMIAWRWLVLYFQQLRVTDVTHNHIPHQGVLTSKISSLVGSEAYVFCREICLERREGLERHVSKSVLSLLKKLYASPQHRLGKLRRRN